MDDRPRASIGRSWVAAGGPAGPAPAPADDVVLLGIDLSALGDGPAAAGPAAAEEGVPGYEKYALMTLMAFWATWEWMKRTGCRPVRRADEDDTPQRFLPATLRVIDGTGA